MFSHARIDRAEWIVQKVDIRIWEHGSSYVYPLFLPATQIRALQEIKRTSSNVRDRFEYGTTIHAEVEGKMIVKIFARPRPKVSESPTEDEDTGCESWLQFWLWA